jgi:hypothetical protein
MVALGFLLYREPAGLADLIGGGARPRRSPGPVQYARAAAGIACAGAAVVGGGVDSPVKP